MKIFKKIKRVFCTHNYELDFTCTYRDLTGVKRLVNERCVNCGKIKKRII